MGYGFKIKCKCQNKSFNLGVGFGFPSVYRETVNAIKAGKYGPEMQGILKGNPYVGVDVTEEIYVCDSCGCVESMQTLNLYEPKDIEKIKKRPLGRWLAAEENTQKTLGDYGGLPYFTLYGEGEDYKLLKEYIHTCPGCGKIMTQTSEEELIQKTCPKCKTKYTSYDQIMWD